HAGDERRLQPGAASDVFGVLAVGVGPGAPVAELDRRPGGPDRLRDVVLPSRRARGDAADRDLWRRLPPLHGPPLAHLAPILLWATLRGPALQRVCVARRGRFTIDALALSAATPSGRLGCLRQA